VVPVTDTIRRRDGGVVDRDELVAVQTPQGFRADALRRAHDRAGEATDDATLVEGLGIEVAVVEGEKRNIKITTQDDLVVATTWIEGDRR
jgi:2-C-methyl-D-erythritol 4-phosphate cytidylyltransferase